MSRQGFAWILCFFVSLFCSCMCQRRYVIYCSYTALYFLLQVIFVEISCTVQWRDPYYAMANLWSLVQSKFAWCLEEIVLMFVFVLLCVIFWRELVCIVCFRSGKLWIFSDLVILDLLFVRWFFFLNVRNRGGFLRVRGLEWEASPVPVLQPVVMWRTFFCPPWEARQNWSRLRGRNCVW